VRAKHLGLSKKQTPEHGVLPHCAACTDCTSPIKHQLYVQKKRPSKQATHEATAATVARA